MPPAAKGDDRRQRRARVRREQANHRSPAIRLPSEKPVRDPGGVAALVRIDRPERVLVIDLLPLREELEDDDN
jgi:hypothetical protein